MWTLSKHSRQLALTHSQLESVLLQRTAELQNLSKRLLKVQDEEKRKLSRDLHDSTGQTLAALKISVSFLHESCKQDKAAMAYVLEVAELADQAIAEIRTMSYLLHPPLLDEVGFACAAEWYVEGFAKRSGVTVHLDIATDRPRLPMSVEVALFRVLQESLTNVHRHSGASEVSVCFRHQLGKVILEMRDNGTGISAERLKRLREGNAEAGVGLAGMRERLHDLHGKLEIESVGHGTTLRAIVPHSVEPRSARPADGVEETAASIPTVTQQLPDCPVCNGPVLRETSKTDEDGRAFHMNCYLFSLGLKAESPNGGAFLPGAKGPVTVQPCAAVPAEDCQLSILIQPDPRATAVMPPARNVAWHERPWNRYAAVVTVFVLSCSGIYWGRQSPTFLGSFKLESPIAGASPIPLPPARVAAPKGWPQPKAEQVSVPKARNMTLLPQGASQKNEVVHIGEDVTVFYFAPQPAPSRDPAQYSQLVHIGEDVTMRFFTPVGRNRQILGPNRLDKKLVPESSVAGGANALSQPRATGTKTTN
jgi:two-component sensor histidine kinase